MMNKLILEMKLLDETINSTYSKLVHGDEFFGFILEDGHRDVKEYGKTRIPAGTYRLIQRRQGGFYTRYKQRYGHHFVVELDNVPGFSDILIHIGNNPNDTKGCLCINSKVTFDKHNRIYTGEGSEQQYLEFMEHVFDMFIEYDGIFIKITR